MLIKNECGPFYYLLVMAYMAFPTDEEKREQYGQVIVATAAKNIDEGRSVTLTQDTIDGLLSAAKSGAANGLDDASIGGFMAGEVLLYMLRMRNSGVSSPSLDKAQHLTSEFFGRSKQYNGSNYRGTGRDTVRKNWDSFRSVAHLWAACEVLCQSCPEGRPRAGWIAGNGDAILHLAHAICEDAVNYQPPKAKEPVLLPEKTWRLDGIKTVHYTLPNLTERELELLNVFEPRPRGNSSSPLDTTKMHQ